MWSQLPPVVEVMAATCCFLTAKRVLDSSGKTVAYGSIPGGNRDICVYAGEFCYKYSSTKTHNQYDKYTSIPVYKYSSTKTHDQQVN